MKHFFVVPAIHSENTRGFLDSLSDRALDRVILIDNAAHTARPPLIYPQHVASLHQPGCNIGVAASWNLGARQAWFLGADYVTLASTSMRFKQGMCLTCDEYDCSDGGRAICDLADFCAEHDQWPYGFESMHGWHLITLGRRLFETVGYFDEEFHPAYFEDNDMIWRMRCAGILEPVGGDRSLRKIPWVPTLRYECVQDAHAIQHCDIPVDLAQLGEYFSRKWGGPPGHERFTRPFGAVVAEYEPAHPQGGMSFTEGM